VKPFYERKAQKAGFFHVLLCPPRHDC